MNGKYGSKVTKEKLEQLAMRFRGAIENSQRGQRTLVSGAGKQ